MDQTVVRSLPKKTKVNFHRQSANGLRQMDVETMQKPLAASVLHPFQYACPAKCPKYSSLLSAKKQPMLLDRSSLSRCKAGGRDDGEAKKANSLSRRGIHVNGTPVIELPCSENGPREGSSLCVRSLIF